MAEFIYLGWSAFGRAARSLAKKIKSDGVKFDIIVGIARGGIPLAMVISDELGVKIDIINVKSYTGTRGQRAKPIIVSTLTNGIKGKRVLIVDDLIEEGDTMKTVIRHIEAKRPLKTSTAVLFTKPWNKFKPDFYIKKVDGWVVFPWEQSEIKRVGK